MAREHGAEWPCRESLHRPVARQQKNLTWPDVDCWGLRTRCSRHADLADRPFGIKTDRYHQAFHAHARTHKLDRAAAKSLLRLNRSAIDWRGELDTRLLQLA